MSDRWDAIVIGAGPAGSSVAGHLARAGRRVLLLERETIPREHIGESLLPGVLPYLDALGVRAEIEREGFVRKEGQTFIWGRDRTPWELDFRELDVHPYAYFVERARFDEILARHAARSGAALRERAIVREVRFEAGRATGVVWRDEDGHAHEEHAAFVVDASGQSALVARGASLRRPIRGLKNLGVWSYWKGAARLPGHAASHIFTVSIPSGWIWCIPLRERMSVGVVTTHGSRWAGAADLERWYEEQLRACEPVWALLAAAERCARISTARDWSYGTRRTSGPGIFLSGDAACFLDPILSTGVHLAMTSAYWASACIHSSLAKPSLEPVYRHFYDEQYATTFRELMTQVKSFYRFEGRRDSVYWQSRAILRGHDAVPARLAFLFVTAGLLRNAAEQDPNRLEPALTRAFGSRAGVSVDEIAAPIGLVPPRAIRLGPEGEARLVTLRARGLDLEIVPYTPHGVRDRPRGRSFAIEVADDAHEPLALAIVGEAQSGGSAQSGSRWSVELLPYAHRTPANEAIAGAHRALAAFVDRADDRTRPLRAQRLRAAIRREGPGLLPDGMRLVDRRAFAAPRLDEPAVTLVLETPEPDLASLYLRVEPRLPPEMTELPPLRTRFLDLWVEPGRTRTGEPVEALASVKQLLAVVCPALAAALRGAGSTKEALDRAEVALGSIDTGRFRRRAFGRILSRA